ncbi:DUF1311 domain-containing protein [Pseudomonas capeferrum]|uniref:lysozyme inhibitor LprI family protein n=1 Tax=Pseudomonas capeferrum TaxID=1495066 RepID=UPI0015E29321|nr:lysozyme inhibitor LprI family protein [Pseudomonas capeferrum]MBA1201891.1 DUF1311 domain-containing protein [Pseudomonas capeferrum]
MLKRYLLLTVTMACITSFAQAEDYSTTYTQCMDKASSTLAMSSCITAETQLQDNRLNRVYKQLMTRLDSDRQKRLREVQRNWIKYRDGNCAFMGRLSDGTLHRIDGAMCLLGATGDRAAELERVLSPGQ